MRLQLLFLVLLLPCCSAAHDFHASVGKVNDPASGSGIQGAWVAQYWEVSGDQHPSCRKVSVSRSGASGTFVVPAQPFSLPALLLNETELSPLAYVRGKTSLAYWTLSDSQLVDLPAGAAPIAAGASGVILGDKPDFAEKRSFPKSIATGRRDINLVDDPRSATERIKSLLTWTNIGPCTDMLRQSPVSDSLYSTILSEAVALSTLQNIDDLGRLCFGFYPELAGAVPASVPGKSLGRLFCEAFSNSRQQWHTEKASVTYLGVPPMPGHTSTITSMVKEPAQLPPYQTADAWRKRVVDLAHGNPPLSPPVYTVCSGDLKDCHDQAQPYEWQPFDYGAFLAQWKAEMGTPR